jgi:hypothetical protein
LLTITLPNGDSAIAVSLKCCRPNGIPIIVIQRREPNIAWVIAIHKPPQRSHIIFIMTYRQPEALECTTVSRPNGHNESDAIFSVWIPKGMPTIVIIRIRLPIKYSIAMIKPPNISQMRFPKKFITHKYLFSPELEFCLSDI